MLDEECIECSLALKPTASHRFSRPNASSEPCGIDQITRWNANCWPHRSLAALLLVTMPVNPSPVPRRVAEHEVRWVFRHAAECCRPVWSGSRPRRSRRLRCGIADGAMLQALSAHSCLECWGRAAPPEIPEADVTRSTESGFDASQRARRCRIAGGRRGRFATSATRRELIICRSRLADLPRSSALSRRRGSGTVRRRSPTTSEQHLAAACSSAQAW